MDYGLIQEVILQQKIYLRNSVTYKDLFGGVLEQKNSREMVWLENIEEEKRWYKKNCNAFLKDPFCYAVKNGLEESESESREVS